MTEYTDLAAHDLTRYADFREDLDDNVTVDWVCVIVIVSCTGSLVKGGDQLF